MRVVDHGRQILFTRKQRKQKSPASNGGVADVLNRQRFIMSLSVGERMQVMHRSWIESKQWKCLKAGTRCGSLMPGIRHLLTNDTVAKQALETRD